jgi:hypothetical protein
MSLIIPANTLASGGYEVANSLRFNSGSSDNLSKSLSTPTNDKIFTFSCWFKKSKNATEMNLFGYQPAGNAEAYIGFSDSDQIRYADRDSSDTTPEIFLASNAKLRDVSAWYHVVVSVDTTQGTDSNRAKLYLNGEQITSLASSTYPSQDYTPEMNSSDGTKVIGADNNGNYFNGYMAEVCFIDGQALAADSFGEFDEDSGIWKPIDVSGLTFGDNGFHLDFKSSGSLGADVSGESNNWTVNNLTAIDQSTDTCTNNFATMNPLNQTVSGGVFSEGNLIFTRGGNALSSVSTFAITTGKWYWEWKQLGGSTKVGIGSIDTFTTKASSNAGTAVVTNAGGAHTGGLNTYAYSKNGKSFSQTKDGNNSGVSYGDTWTTNDIIGCAFDATNGTIWFSKNGTWQDSATITEIQNGTTTNAAYSSIASDTFYVIQDGEEAAGVPHSIAVNFGSPPFAISSGNTDGDGFGNFEYAVPSGYFSLNTKNLAEYG